MGYRDFDSGAQGNIRSKINAMDLKKAKRKILKMHDLILGIILIGLAGVAAWYGSQKASDGLKTVFSSESDKITINSVKIFHVELLKDIYQIGIVCEISNIGQEGLLLKKATLKGRALDIVARAPTHIFKIHITQDTITGPIVGMTFLGTDRPSLIRVLLPIKFDMHLKYPLPPEIVFWGQWEITTEDSTISSDASYYGNYDKFIDLDTWKSLLTQRPTIDIGEVQLKAAPQYHEFRGEYCEYILYNADRSAEIEIYGFSRTQYVRNDNGTMTLLVGPSKPPLTGGWEIMGHTYPEIWADPEKLRIYNSIYPPGKNGKPKAFGAFSGRWEHVGVEGGVPTTRAQEYTRLHLNEKNNEKTIDFTQAPKQPGREAKD